MGDALTGKIIAAAIEVHRHLGPGLLESIYGSFGKKSRIRYLKRSAMQHRKKMPRMSAGRFAMECSFRRASCFISLLFFA